MCNATQYSMLPTMQGLAAAGNYRARNVVGNTAGAIWEHGLGLEAVVGPMISQGDDGIVKGAFGRTRRSQIPANKHRDAQHGWLRKCPPDIEVNLSNGSWIRPAGLTGLPCMYYPPQSDLGFRGWRPLIRHSGNSETNVGPKTSASH